LGNNIQVGIGFYMVKKRLHIIMYQSLRIL
jgi:hypothetical protein